MQEWRTHELDWQLTNDARSPKVGDLAPDFELADPTGTKTARLSEFRGRRPVALIFGILVSTLLTLLLIPLLYYAYMRPRLHLLTGS